MGRQLEGTLVVDKEARRLKASIQWFGERLCCDTGFVSYYATRSARRVSFSASIGIVTILTASWQAKAFTCAQLVSVDT